MKLFIKRYMSLATAAFLMLSTITDVQAKENAKQDNESRLTNSLNSISEPINDNELVMLLLTGTGPLADKNPEVVKTLGFKEDRPKPNDEQARKFSTFFLSKNPTFHQDVSNKVLSGRPLEVEDGLKTVTRMSQDTLSSINNADTKERTNKALGAGNIGLWHDAITVAEVLANGAVYANIVVATQLAVAGAEVAVVVVILDYSFNTEKVSPLEREHAISSITNSLHDIQN